MTIELRLTHLQKAVLLLFTMYSLFSSPIPSNTGSVEVLMAFVLIYIVIAGINEKIVNGVGVSNVSIISALILVVVPTLIGTIFNQHEMSNYIRDFIPLLFLLLPVVLYTPIKSAPIEWLRILSLCFTFTGFIFCIRYLILGDGQAFEDIYIFETAPINQCPTVIFAAIYGISNGISGRQRLLGRSMLFFIGIFCLTTLVMSAMRAQIAIIIIASFFSIAFMRADQKLPKILTAIVCLVIGIAFNYEVISDVIYWAVGLVLNKNSLSGGLLNGRDAEANTIIKYFMSSPIQMLFGDGWGAELYLPSAAEVVRFAHQGFFYFIWKTGIVGTVSIIVFCFTVIDLHRFSLDSFCSSFKLNSVEFFSAFSAFIIFGGIEMGYKMVSFGFLICIFQAIILSANKSKTVVHHFPVLM